MTQQGMPKPIELYEGAVGYMRPILAGIQPPQLTAATPCSDWNVQQLISHNLKVAQMVHSMLTGGSGVDPFDVGGPLPPEGAVEAFAAASASVLEAIKAPGMAEKIIETPFGEMPGAQFMMIPFADVLIHKWDLAKATGQDTSLDAGLSEACFGVMQIGTEMWREQGFFGPEITVPISASIQDKLLGISGRQP